MRPSRSATLALTGLLFVCAGVTIPDAYVQIACLASGGMTAAMSFLLSLRERTFLREHKIRQMVLEDFISQDATPTFTTDLDGAIVTQNEAADTSFKTEPGDTLGRALRGLLANPSAVISRLEAKAGARGGAREDVVSRRGHVRISVHRLFDGKLLWRMEDMADRTKGGRRADGLSLPMMTVSKSGTILFMNDALRKVLGGRVRRIEDVFADEAFQPGPMQTIKGQHGVLDCQVVDIEGAGGRREVYLLPQTAAQNVTMPDAPVLDSLPVALLWLDDGGSVSLMNRLAGELLGPNLGKGSTFSELFEGLGRPVGDWLAECQQGRGLNRPQVVRVRRSDQDVYLQITLSPAPEGEGLVAVLSDATELKTLEAQFVQSQKMQAIGQLAGGVAHDFNNLLTAISGHCDLLLLRHDPADSDYSDLVQINQNANRAAALVSQLLAFSRKQTLRPEVLDLRDTLSDLTHLLNRLVGEKTTLTLEHDPSLTPIRADKRQLEQVIVNLVVNARDAMPGGGEVSIQTETRNFAREFRRDRAVVPPGRYVVIKVTDQGVGIPADKVRTIFEPFYTTKRNGEGTGLGLSTAYGIVKQTGGYIFVESVEGAGSCFTILLPSYVEELPAPEPVKPVAIATPPQQGEGVVLLVEDEAPVRAFASRALRLRGYTVIEAENAEMALETLEDEDLAIDVFVTDVIMPGMDGPSWVRKALEHRPDVKVVFVSGYSEGTFEDEQLPIPNSVFLPKPFSLNELTATVRAQIH
ncbi:response regulator [Alphaproteobacteria bacterium KMM 3653]|uniref:histidine kinase n=1 Tax=Harenicola maris TaxID=2841044 RepID=A0AAP2G329_9RHOB|nr:response regulator [Harenicola maris]